MRAGRRINGAGQALYHAFCVLLPVRHAQRLVIRCACPFVKSFSIVLSQRHIPARLSRFQSHTIPTQTTKSVIHPSIHRRHHVPVQSHGYLGSRWASAAPVGLPATRLKSARRGRRWPPPSGEMPATLSLRNSPREEAPLAFPGHTALRRKSPKLKLTTFFSVEAPCLPHLALKSPGRAIHVLSSNPISWASRGTKNP